MAEMGIFDVMYSTRALRRFKPDPVPDDVIAKVVEAGTQAASGSNDQHWLFLVVTDAAQRKRVAEECHPTRDHPRAERERAG